jgi:hypothetical protein
MKIFIIVDKYWYTNLTRQLSYNSTLKEEDGVKKERKIRLVKKRRKRVDEMEKLEKSLVHIRIGNAEGMREMRIQEREQPSQTRVE